MSEQYDAAAAGARYARAWARLAVVAYLDDMLADWSPTPGDIDIADDTFFADWIEPGPLAPESVPAAAVADLMRAGVLAPGADEAEAGYKLETYRLMRMEPVAQWVAGYLREVKTMLYEAHLAKVGG